METMEQATTPALSPTSISLFLDCPQAWYYRYCERRPMPESAPALAGTFLHKSVANYLTEGADPLWGELLDTIAENTEDDPVAVMGQAQRQWDTWRANAQFTAPDGVEVEILTATPDLGRVHCVLDYVQVPFLIDHKFMGKMRKKDALQLAFYRRFAPCTTRWGYECITPEEYRVQWVTAQEMAKADVMIDQTVQQIREGDYPADPRPYGRAPYCKYCPFDCPDRRV
jgi:hypothetical protein